MAFNEQLAVKLGGVDSMDSRFRDVFDNKEFFIDEKSDAFKLINPVAAKNRKSASGRGGVFGDSSEDEDYQEALSAKSNAAKVSKAAAAKESSSKAVGNDGDDGASDAHSDGSASDSDTEFGLEAEYNSDSDNDGATGKSGAGNRFQNPRFPPRNQDRSLLNDKNRGGKFFKKDQLRNNKPPFDPRRGKSDHRRGQQSNHKQDVRNHKMRETKSSVALRSQKSFASRLREDTKRPAPGLATLGLGRGGMAVKFDLKDGRRKWQGNDRGNSGSSSLPPDRQRRKFRAPR